MSKIENGIRCVFFRGTQRIEGILTTEHAASSYKLPVFVQNDGAAMGAAEVEPLLVLYLVGQPAGVVGNSGMKDASDFYARAEMAGYRWINQVMG